MQRINFLTIETRKMRGNQFHFLFLESILEKIFYQYVYLSCTIACITPISGGRGVASYLNIAKKKLKARFNKSRGTLKNRSTLKNREKIIFNIENQEL